MKKIILIVLMVLFWSPAFAATRYVDQTSAACSGNYSIANRTCTGSDGYSYTTIQAALNAMNAGDWILMRGGEYDLTTFVDPDPAKNGSGWELGNYNLLASYPGEWAILDGQNQMPVRGSAYYEKGQVLGRGNDDPGAGGLYAYWIFERFEVKNGGTTGEVAAAGIWVSGSPLKFRYLYIHDNLAINGSENPSGLVGNNWKNNIVEYCLFSNNGSGSADNNNAHIKMEADGLLGYDTETATNGFTSVASSSENNTFRYNYFSNNPYGLGIKHKHPQMFSSRNPAGGHDWDDTYKNYGDKIHHNVFDNLNVGIMPEQDFAQIYNNVFHDIGYTQVYVQYQPNWQYYKLCIYNNTFLNAGGAGAHIMRYGVSDGSIRNGPLEHYGYDINNIFDTSNNYAMTYSNCKGVTFISSATSSGGTGAIFDLTGYLVTNNYWYRPSVTGLARLHTTSYTAAEFEAQTLTMSPRVVYTAAYDAGNLLYNADGMTTLGTHTMEGTTISAGGLGGAHPYLAGVTIPSYVGATNPNDNAWVAGVQGLNVAYFTTAVNGSTPSWVEGETPTTTNQYGKGFTAQGGIVR